MADEKPKRAAMLYYQLASVLLLLVLVGFTISGLWGLMRMGIPQLTVSGYEWRKVSSLDNFVEDKYREENGLYYKKGSKEDTTKASAIDSQKVEMKWQIAKSDALAEERRVGLQQILLWLVVVIICLPLYIYHHGAVKKAHKMLEQSAGM